MRDGRLEGVEAVIERQQRVPPEGDDHGLLFARQHGRARLLGTGALVLDRGALLPLGRGLRVDPVALGQHPQALLTMLDRATHCRRRAGAPMENLAHSASLHSAEKSAPSNPGTKHLENGGEMLRAALNSLAAAAPDWLAQHAEHGWVDRYGRRVEDYRLPKGEVARRERAESIGADGHRLLAAVYDPAAPMWLRDLPAVQALRRTWVQQFSLQEDRVSWRDRADLPPARTRIHSAYDTDASFGDKRTMTWIGYKAHVTETCDADAPHVITHVVTTPAPVPDTAVTAPLHAALAGKSLLPRTHFIDAGYVDADLLLDIGAEHEVELMSPIRPDARWQAQAGQGY